MAQSRQSVEAKKRSEFLSRFAQIVNVSRAVAENLLSLPRRNSVRLNPLKAASPEALVTSLRRDGYSLSPLDWCPNGYEFAGDRHELAESHYFKEGFVYIQNASSFVPTLALDPHEGDSILDVSAAPGGKASHIAAIVQNKCDLWVNDPLEPRIHKLKEVLTTLGVDVSHITQFQGQYVDKYIPRQFDKVLLDAQCSGEGLIDLRRKNALRFWSISRIRKYSRLQQRMLVASFKLVRPGGTLVYSTCTFAPEENEHPIDHLVRHFSEAEVQPIELELPGLLPGLSSWAGKTFDPQVTKAIRLLPSELMEGFYVCKIRRRAT